MFTDDQSRQSNGQNGFVRRNMTNPRFDGEKTTPSYQNNSDYSAPSTPSYGSGGGYNSQPRRHGGEGGTGGYRGGYTNNRTGGYTNNRTGGYNRNNQTRDSGGASSDRAIRQNDVIIKLLKEIRDRLPPPPAGTQSYDSSADTAHESYKSESSYHAADAGDDGASDISGGPGNGGGNVSVTAAAGGDTDGEEDKFNS